MPFKVFLTRKILWLKNNLTFECENDKASYTKGGHIRLHKGTGDIGTPPRYGERRISKELYDELRDGTPDPALPGKYITDRLQADHIVSMKNIAKMKNFDKLTKEQQLKVLNNEENFLGLSEAANKSKGSKSYSDWTIYKKEKIEVDPKFREEMIKKEKELEMKLQKQIDDFVEGNKKDIDK